MSGSDDAVHDEGDVGVTPERVIDFGPCRISFDQRVLEPRPWTVEQSRWAAEEAKRLGPGAILELCAGAGQIGLLAAVLSDRRLVQVDQDPVACAFALDNASTAGLAHRVEVRCSPLETAVREEERFQVVLADPPYIPSNSVSRFPGDPRSAIDGGSDGLDIARTCLKVIDQVLSPSGVAILQLAGLVQFRLLEDCIPTALRLDSIREIDSERALGLLRRHG